MHLISSPYKQMWFWGWGYGVCATKFLKIPHLKRATFGASSVKPASFADPAIWELVLFRSQHVEMMQPVVLLFLEIRPDQHFLEYSIS